MYTTFQRPLRRLKLMNMLEKVILAAGQPTRSTPAHLGLYKVASHSNPDSKVNYSEMNF